ncbi:MAG: hypothetical protein OXB86_01795 [Bdellovibrionales bacterium]|nr:hypothetical protein [Bdellovibrionales bacterium]
MKQILLCSLMFFSLTFLQGCVSTSAQWKDKSYKPVKKGTLFYNPINNLFDSEAVQKRRTDAKMKMADFCSPQTPQIISEKNKEEVTGYRTDYSARKDNPYYSKSKAVKTTRASGKGLFSYSASSSASNPVLHSNESQTSTAITRKRVYIDFVCK